MYAMAPGLMNNIRFDLQILGNELSRITGIGIDATNPRGSKIDGVDGRTRKKICHCLRVAEVEFIMAAQDKLDTALCTEGAHQRCAHHAAMTGHEDAPGATERKRVEWLIHDGHAL